MIKKQCDCAKYRLLDYLDLMSMSQRWALLINFTISS